MPFTNNSYFDVKDEFIREKTELKEYKSYVSSQLGIKYSLKSI
jgi:hypothetical protein